MIADLGFARSDLGGGEVAGRHVVVVPEVQVHHLAAREELPDLRREDAEVRAAIGGGLRPGVPDEDVQHTHTELAVLALLTPHARRRVHQRRERAVRCR